ncbi:MAG TPA: hypothetical protein VGV92_06300 [Gammaproteobacteria bacterium]|nr:hypothetical protein [Gammaproteobacteria bacterium]
MGEWGFLGRSAKKLREQESQPQNPLPDLLYQYHVSSDQLDEVTLCALRAKIISALREGVDPTQILPDKDSSLIGAKGNTVLTAALVKGDQVLINAVFEIFEPGHLIFSVMDGVCLAGNSPLSLALKTGRYDLAEELILKKACDVDGIIGNFDFTRIHLLHLCAFLMGTYYGIDNAQEERLVRIMKAILERTQNKEVLLSEWGHTPHAVLMLDVGQDDFLLYKDSRKKGAYYSSLRELKQSYGDPAEFPTFYTFVGKIFGRSLNVFYMLNDHCHWHRPDIDFERRTAYFSSDEGRRVREELAQLMKPSSPRPK